MFLDQILWVTTHSRAGHGRQICIYRHPSHLRVEETSRLPAGVSLVVPAWNEERRLPGTLSSLIPALKDRTGPYEVIVVVDGVSDRTAEVAEAFSGEGVRVLRFAHRLGKGGAIIAGIQASGYRAVGFMDADGPVPPVELLSMFDDLKSYDCVIASRKLPESRVINREPAARRWFSWVWGFLVRSLLSIPIHDTQCGAKVFRREPLLESLRKVTVTSWAFDVCLLFHLSQDHFTILERPVTWAYSEGSRLRIRSAMPTMLASLVGLRIMSLPIAEYVPKTWLSKAAVKFGFSRPAKA